MGLLLHVKHKSVKLEDMTREILDVLDVLGYGDDFKYNTKGIIHEINN